ncbi:MAG TPA: hypothetical protein DCS54_03285 [Oribacterium sp.]|jgi:hypothetical protein|nr:hypothetical protein [Oribacterium sp.]
MLAVSNVGNGYYNYYHNIHRVETKPSKAIEAWYTQELSKESLRSSNVGIQSYETELAASFRKLASTYEEVAAENRNKYRTSGEVYAALHKKYYGDGSEYTSYSEIQKVAMFSNELSMTLYGVIGDVGIADYSTILKDPHLNTDKGKDQETGSKDVNAQTLSAQIGNVLRKYGVDLGANDQTAFLFSIDGMTKNLSISVLNNDPTWRADEALLNQMSQALNSKNNSKNLFYDLLYNGARSGTNAADQLSKWSIWSNFNQMTGQDIRSFTQTSDGFLNERGVYAREIFKEALTTSGKIPSEYRAAAYEHFLQQEENALQYNLSKVSDLTLSLIYRNGSVMFGNPSAKGLNRLI